MGVSTYISAIVPPDTQYLKMLKVWEVCTTADVDVPAEVEAFFEPMTDNGYEPTDEGMQIGLYGDDSIEGDVEYNDGAVIDLSKLPKRVPLIYVST